MISHPLLCFNESTFSQIPYQKHLGIFLCALLTFEEHLKVITTKVNKTMGVLGKLQKKLPRAVLMTIYKTFVRPHLDYGDIISDEACNKAFHQKHRSIYIMLAQHYRQLLQDRKRKTLPNIRHEIPPTLTLVQETLLTL